MEVNNQGIMFAISESARNNTILSLTYKAKDGKVSYRSVEPYEIKDGGLFAYDIAKGSIRKFLISSILSAESQDAKFNPRYPVQI